jgi:hypothetical protein
MGKFGRTKDFGWCFMGLNSVKDRRQFSRRTMPAERKIAGVFHSHHRPSHVFRTQYQRAPSVGFAGQAGVEPASPANCSVCDLVSWFVVGSFNQFIPVLGHDAFQPIHGTFVERNRILPRFASGSVVFVGPVLSFTAGKRCFF